MHTSGDVTRGERCVEVGVYRWRCPICDASNVCPPRGADPVGNALRALQSHVRAASGDGHGPQHELPDSVSRAELESHVERPGA